MCQKLLTYEDRTKEPLPASNGDRLPLALMALASPHRLRIVAALAKGGRNYVSRLAREVGINRPLLHMNLNRLEDEGLVTQAGSNCRPTGGRSIF